eukprot:2269363-Amphidinium_carterae.1
MAQSTLKSWTLAGQAAKGCGGQEAARFVNGAELASPKAFLWEAFISATLPGCAVQTQPQWRLASWCFWGDANLVAQTEASSSTDGPQDLQVCVGDADAVVELEPPVHADA